MCEPDWPDRPDADDLPHTEWKCETCGAVNSCLDGDCQYCPPLKPRDLRNLLNRAAAVIEDPNSETVGDRLDLIEQLIYAARTTH